MNTVKIYLFKYIYIIAWYNTSWIESFSGLKGYDTVDEYHTTDYTLIGYTLLNKSFSSQKKRGLWWLHNDSSTLKSEHAPFL